MMMSSDHAHDHMSENEKVYNLGNEELLLPFFLGYKFFK